MNTILQALSDFGLIVDGFVPDGGIHRCHSNAKRKKNRDGWYSAKEYKGHVFCAYGCWIRNEKGKISTLNGSEASLSKSKKIWQELEERRIAAEIEKTNRAIKMTDRFLSACAPADPNHPYLVKKSVRAHGCLMSSNRALIVPVINPQGHATSYQVIGPDGGKKFVYAGVVGGGCFPIPGNASTICICEGYATGASIHEATGFKVLVAFNAGNLPKVAREAVRKFPDADILICADNDHSKPTNTGLNVAKKIGFDLGLPVVYPQDIKGSDFNDMADERGMHAVREAICQKSTIECLSAEDCISCDDSLVIPPGAIAPGLISEGLEALEEKILQYSLPLVLTVISRAIAGKISLNWRHPNVFNIKVGATSTGKTDADKKFLRCLNIDNFISINDVASGPGLWRAIADNPKGMGMFDEISSLFKRNNSRGGVDMIADGKISVLLDAYSRSGETFKKSFGDKKNNVTVTNPCFSLVGNATPQIFEAIQMEDFATGLMQRFDFWMYDGPILPKAISGEKYFVKTCNFIQKLNEIINLQPKRITLADQIRECIDLPISKRAEDLRKEYSEYIIEEANKADSDGAKGFVSRRYDLALKYALIHHASVCGAAELFTAVTAQDLEYGILIAEMLGGWKSHVLIGKVVSGDFHRDCEIFKAAILGTVKAGKKNPGFATLANRRSQLKNWTPKYSEAVINVLKKRGEIITREMDATTRYYLPKEPS